MTVHFEPGTTNKALCGGAGVLTHNQTLESYVVGYKRGGALNHTCTATNCYHGPWDYTKKSDPILNLRPTPEPSKMVDCPECRALYPEWFESLASKGKQR